MELLSSLAQGSNGIMGLGPLNHVQNNMEGLMGGGERKKGKGFQMWLIVIITMMKTVIISPTLRHSDEVTNHFPLS